MYILIVPDEVNQPARSGDYNIRFRVKSHVLFVYVVSAHHEAQSQLSELTQPSAHTVRLGRQLSCRTHY